MNNHRLLTTLLVCVFCCIAVSLSAETTTTRHEIRIGYADALVPYIRFSSASYYERTFDLSTIEGMSVMQADRYLRSNYSRNHTYKRTTGHVFLEYQYHISPLLSAGITADLLMMRDNVTQYNGYGSATDYWKNNLYIWSLIPTVRFTYHQVKHTQLYSALGIGYTACTGQWNKTLLYYNGATLNATLLGVNVGGEHLFCAFELGCQNSILASPTQTWWLPFSRILSLSVGYRF